METKKEIVKLINKVGLADFSIQLSTQDFNGMGGVFFKLSLKNGQEVFLNQWYHINQVFEKPQIEVWSAGGNRSLDFRFED